MREWHSFGDEKIAAQYDRNGDRVMPARGIYLLFEQGGRPDRSEVREFIDANRNVTLSFDPASPQLRVVGGGAAMLTDSVECEVSLEGAADWVELLFNGLTFDLKGLAPAQPETLPSYKNPFDYPSSAGVHSLEPVLLVPGEHLSGGDNSLPVIRGMMALARDLIHHFNSVQAVAWPPAESVIGRRFFESTVTAWLDGGAFPALGLTSFELCEDGSLHSVGLSHFIGQELRIDEALAVDPVAATRLGVRLANQLVLTGGVAAREQIIAPDGVRLAMEPSENGKIVRVWIE